jgi:nitroreductase
MLKELIRKNRSYRRFYQEEKISRETLLELLDYARLSASGGNKQPLRYALAYDKELNEKVFATLAWAGYLTDWPGPEEGEKPSAYIAIVHKKTDQIIGGVDHGIAAQSILLGAVEKGWAVASLPL